RDIAQASLGNVPTGERSLPVMDTFLGILLAGGVSPEVASLSVDILALYFTATAYEESLTRATGGGTDAKAPHHDELHDFFSSLPPARFPHLVAMAGPLTSADRDERFEFGLDLLVRGIASTVRPPRARC
ncbi:MAG TPA: TetR/AcrR family transcriptional regulator C-terminal domain-containing protein, partial [Jatrophihabitantaceae bacterium]|nr:TetR/AcrR family transcriptional regulator C-terminal domain-containing protein [Jatrophihabitantaceae bacterium]